MREYQQKRKLRRYIYSPVTFFALLVLVIIFARATWGVYQKSRESAIEAKKAEQELVLSQTKQTALSEDINRLRTSAGVEAEIRDKFNVAKEGEKTIIIVNQNGSGGATSTGQSFFAKIWNTIVGWFGGR